MVSLTSCATPDLLGTAQASNEPIYRCALEHTVRLGTASFEGFYRADGTAISPPDISTYALDHEPRLVEKLKAHFASLTANPAEYCSIDDGEDGYYRQHGFSCSRSWQEGSEQFSVSTKHVSWALNEGDKRLMSLGWSVSFGPDFAASGFPWGERLGPIFHVERPEDWEEANSRIFNKSGKRLLEDRYHETGEVRSGARHYGEWSVSNLALSVPWEVWPKLHEAGEPIEVILHDNDLDLTRRYTLDADFPKGIEAKLKMAYAALKLRELDPVNQCEHTAEQAGGPVIILY